MKISFNLSTFIIIIIMISSQILNAQSLPDDIDISTSPNGVVDLPNSVPSAYINDGFVKYTKISCPNGEAIHIVAQNNLTEAQIVRARTIMEFYLTDVPNSQYGADKTNLINTMGTNEAILLLLNGSDNGSNEPSVPGQWLFEEEIAVEGHSWYQTNNYEHRDATFEEILHLVHDMGIGVDGINSIDNPALPDFQQEIRNAQQTAGENNFAIWPIGADGSVPDIQSWYNELSQENSLSQEYLASVIDSYYGLWDAFTEEPNLGMWGIYIAHNRDEIQTEDPSGWSLIPKFFSPYINVDMIIDPSFNGVFSLTFVSSNDYTSKSRYLQHCYLSGTNPSGLKGNELYNRLKGNSANNTLEGLKGNDRLDGKAGIDTAIFSGVSSEYNITNVYQYAIVEDQVVDRDGVDTLFNIQYLKFTDQTIPINLSNNSSLNQLMPEIEVFPNPAKDILNIRNIGNYNTLEIIGVSGRIIYHKKLNEDNNVIDVSNLSKGIYFARLSSPYDVRTLKFIKK